jgi:starvation-inducible DNA-binding protein
MTKQSNAHIANFTVPGVDPAPARQAIELLEAQLAALIDLQLTLKHVHWNVVGSHFIGVHEMLDPQVSAVCDMTDSIAERIATLGGVPNGTPAAVAAQSSSDDYPLTRATVPEHLGALDVFYTRVNAALREAITDMAGIDAVSEDLLIGHLAQLEQFQWFIRAHLETADGVLPTAGETREVDAARVARRA